MQSEETMLKELFIEELRDIYWAEKHLTKELQNMKKADTSEELDAGFEYNLDVK
jgi:ferritin-like metal-binding protein YciE